ncbi:MAG: SDR family oxidoreductase, partial [Vulcanimicrobiaceae bacterium]
MCCTRLTSYCHRRLGRTSGLYGLRGSRSKGSSFIERILAQAEEGTPIRVVTDVVTSPSCTVDVARGIRALVDGAPPGTYHVANGGACSWYEFACAALRLAGFAEARVEPTTAAAFPSKVRRPPYSALAGEGLARAGIAPLADWQSALAGYFAQRSLARAVR